MPLKSLTLANHPNKHPHSPPNGPKDKNSAKAPAVGLSDLLRGHRQRRGRIDLSDRQKQMRASCAGIDAISKDSSANGGK